MNIEEADKLINKAMTVILSCKTMDQLKTAVLYSNLVYKVLSNEIGLGRTMKFITLIERSIGFAQCQIQENKA